VYGRFHTYFAVLGLAEVQNVNHDRSLYPLISSMIKKRYEKRTDIANIESLDSAEKLIKSLDKKIKKLKKETLDIPEIEDER